MLEQLVHAGMNVARLNMSHADAAQATEIVKNLRDICARLQVSVGILMDTQGPAIRTGDLPVDLVRLPVEARDDERAVGAVGPRVHPPERLVDLLPYGGVGKELVRQRRQKVLDVHRPAKLGGERYAPAGFK